MRRALAAASAAAVALAGCTTGSGHGAGGPSPTATATGATAVRPLTVALPAIEHFVEKERGLRFKHPVKVKLLGEHAFVAKLRKSEGQPKPAR